MPGEHVVHGACRGSVGHAGRVHVPHVGGAHRKQRREQLREREGGG